MSEAKFNVAVLGLGSIGLRHAKNLMSAGAAVVGFDPDEARQKVLSAAGADIAKSRTDALSRCDAVVVASPNKYHLDDLQAAIAARRHVMVEKPLAHRLDGMDQLLSQAKANGTIVFPAHNLRYNPVIVAARRWIEDGQLGALLWGRLLCASYLPDWRPGQDHLQGYANDPQSGGVIFDIIHEFDLARYLLGPYRVSMAWASNSQQLGLATEDCADIVLEHDSGIRSTLHLDYLTRPPMRVCEIAGSKNFLKIDIRSRRAELIDREGRQVAFVEDKGGVSDDYRAEANAFLECIAGRTEPRCSATEALGILTCAVEARQMAGLPGGNAWRGNGAPAFAGGAE